MIISIDVTLRGVAQDPMPQSLYATIREAFEQETPINLLPLPDAKIQHLEHAVGGGEWSVSFQAQGSYYAIAPEEQARGCAAKVNDKWEHGR